MTWSIGILHAFIHIFMHDLYSVISLIYIAIKLIYLAHGYTRFSMTMPRETNDKLYIVFLACLQN